MSQHVEKWPQGALEAHYILVSWKGQIRKKFLSLSLLLFFLISLQMHIPGHAGYRGNEEADRLSRDGAAKPLEEQHEEGDDDDDYD